MPQEKPEEVWRIHCSDDFGNEVVEWRRASDQKLLQREFSDDGGKTWVRDPPYIQQQPGHAAPKK
jgi:hypothetical protein